MRAVVVQFAGTNCEFDTDYALKKIGFESQILWHQETTIPQNTDLVVIAGGFSYGDYLRSGAIARFSPIMGAVSEFAKKGGNVLGICNGFQVLLEARLLEGAMKHNENLHFVSKFHHLKVLSNNNTFLHKFNQDDILNIPIAHAEGNYSIDEAGLKSLYDNDQVLLSYCDAKGEVLNPNGSIDAIAGICNKERNVFGLMPHPERAMERLLGSEDGKAMLEGFLK